MYGYLPRNLIKRGLCQHLYYSSAPSQLPLPGTPAFERLREKMQNASMPFQISQEVFKSMQGNCDPHLRKIEDGIHQLEEITEQDKSESNKVVLDILKEMKHSLHHHSPNLENRVVPKPNFPKLE